MPAAAGRGGAGGHGSDSFFDAAKVTLTDAAADNTGSAGVVLSWGNYSVPS
ncbi:hypothetical protein ACH4U6_34505 [Streptomyces netropsis]|uniref:hypothetical protein n=1 Tax=Streptomyces netropsis TaxID=55404 RepID=UPI00378852B9